MFFPFCTIHLPPAEERDIGRITVKELTEKAEINKTTFYAHYETLPDLVNTLEAENIVRKKWN